MRLIRNQKLVYANRGFDSLLFRIFFGRVAEWPNASVLKTEGDVSRPGVRIPPLPTPLRLIKSIRSIQQI